MEHPSVETLEMGDVVDRLGDEINRDEVERSALGADERHPLREGVAHLLDELEGVVRAVDPVRLAGLGRTDDHARAVDPPRHRRLTPNDALGLVLGLVIRVVELLALIEHRLGEGAFEAAGNRDGAHQMKAGGLNLVRQPDDVARARDVGALGLVGRSGQVVDGGQVKDVGAAELLSIVERRAQARAR